MNDSDIRLEIPMGVYSYYKVDTYINDAIELQAMSKEKAYTKLSIMAGQKGQKHRVYALCRMLFTKKGGSDFRGPRIGAPGFIGHSDYTDWPLEPVEILDGVPFMIVRGYNLGGVPEAPEMYLNYCINNCVWNSFKYSIKTKQQKEEALKKLLSSSKWKGRLDTDDIEFLTKQIN